MQAWVDGLLATDWFMARWGDRRLEVRPGFGHRRATADENGVLQMPKWARTELVLLHEMAHCLTPATVASHGPEYAGVLLTLARRGMGPATAQALEDAFARQRVRWTLASVPDVRPSVATARAAVGALAAPVTAPGSSVPPIAQTARSRRGARRGAQAARRGTPGSTGG